MGSVIGHRIDCNGVWALRGQQHMPGGGGERGGKDRNLLLIVNIQFKVNNMDENRKFVAKSIVLDLIIFFN